MRERTTGSSNSKILCLLDRMLRKWVCYIVMNLETVPLMLRPVCRDIREAKPNDRRS